MTSDMDLVKGTTKELLGTAEELMVSGQVTEAIAVFSQAVDTEPGNWAVYLSRAGAYTHLESFDKALADIEQALRLCPEDSPLHLSVVLGHAGRIRGALGLDDQALADFKRALELADIGDTLKFRGEFFFEKQRYQEAFSDLLKVAGKDKKSNRFDVQVYPKLAIVCHKLGKQKEAESFFNQVIVKYGDAKMFEEALAVCDQASECSSLDVSGRSLRPAYLLELGRYPEAIKEADAVLSLPEAKSDTKEAMLALKGRCHMELMQPDLARAALSEAINLAPNRASYQVTFSMTYLSPSLEEATEADLESALVEVDKAILLAQKSRDAVCLEDATKGKVMILKALGRNELAQEIAATPPKLSKPRGCGKGAALVMFLPLLAWFLTRP